VKAMKNVVLVYFVSAMRIFLSMKRSLELVETLFFPKSDFYLFQILESDE